MSRSAAATHCTLCPAPIPEYAWLRQTALPSNGVLAFDIRDSWGPSPGSGVDYLQVEVRDEAGAPISGTLEKHPEFAVVAWRPTEGWTPGTIVQVSWTLDVEQIFAERAPGTVCPNVTATEAIEILPSVELVEPEVATRVELEVRVQVDRAHLEDLVCCDESYPEYRGAGSQPGSCPSGRFETGPGICSSRVAERVMLVEHAVLPAAMTDAQASNLTLRVGGVVVHDGLLLVTEHTEPACTSVELLDLVRGTVSVTETCHGEDLDVPLGEFEHDPSDELAACDGGAYVCAVEPRSERWDQENCQPWPAREDDGCGCNVLHRTSVTATVLALLCLVRRRRRSDPM